MSSMDPAKRPIEVARRFAYIPRPARGYAAPLTAASLTATHPAVPEPFVQTSAGYATDRDRWIGLTPDADLLAHPAYRAGVVRTREEMDAFDNAAQALGQSCPALSVGQIVDGLIRADNLADDRE